MKDLVKKVFFNAYRPFSKIDTDSFSNYFSNLGYFIKSEALYNKITEIEVKDRDVMHEMLSSKTVDPLEKVHFLEFGVYRGQSFLMWVKNNKHSESKFTGFDTFTGLPEDWGNEKKGSYSAQGSLPNTNDPRVQFEVGLIQDTLPGYLKNIRKGVKKVIHIDVDLYNASLFTLVFLQPYLEKGDIIIFDDFFTITKASHEFRAFYDFLSLFKLEYKPIVKCRRGHLAIEVL
jgi:Macrocin-O-methyltransferase (TylF)